MTPARRPRPVLRRASRPGDLPLSFAQQRLWFLDQLVPGNPFYNIQAAWRLRGRLDRDALAAALAAVVRRHEVLRTRFPARDGRPVQVVEPVGATALQVVDLAGAEAEAEAGRLAAETFATAFDLSVGPPWQARLLRLDALDHVLVLTLHHIVFDAWSLGVLARELGALYEARLAGRPSPLAPLAVDYADYAIWERELLGGGALASGLDHWRRRLAGAPPVLDLPADHARPPRPSYRGGRVGFAVPDAAARRLRDLSRSAGTTLYMTVLAAFQVLLGRYAGAEDVVVGSPMANRSPRVLEDLVGCFVNMVALRADLSGD
ncbi:MAG TPA: condensation domain-containing protein, partial [Candidatus Dormibacteraeota bacterium]|nr:condensation domain-containing protein [Candidatus Dormibacteraeota bacterium]